MAEQKTEFDHTAKDCPCPWCISERMAHCLLTQGADEHPNHYVVVCPALVISPGVTTGGDQ